MTIRPLPAPATVDRIFVRLTNWVGDVVMGTPFLQRLRGVYPNADIVAAGRSNVTGLLVGHPSLNEVWTINDRGAGGFVSTAKRIRAGKFDLGFSLPNASRAALLMLAGGVRARAGYARDGRGALLTHPVPLRPDDLAVHEVRYYLRLLDATFPREGPPPDLLLSVTPDEIAGARAWLASIGVQPGQPVIGVNPAAFYGTAKRWHADRYRAVAAHLVRAHNARIVVTGLPTERDVAAEVCRDAGPAFHNAAGEMKLRQLMAFLACADLFLTNDSGAMHIAAALGTPLVAVFGSTDWVTTAPLGEMSSIVRAETDCAPCLLRHCPIDHRCMNRVEVGHVIASAEEMLSRRQPT